MVQMPVPGTNVGFAGNPPVSPAYGTSDPGAVNITYQIDGGPATSIPFDTGTGNWNLPNLTAVDCPTVGDQYTLIITAYYPPPAPPPGPPPFPPPTGTSQMGQCTFTRTS